MWLRQMGIRMSKPLNEAELVDRARSLAPQIAKRAEQSESERVPHDDSIQDLIDAELLQTLVPKRWGGHESTLNAHSQIISAISAADMSTGWIAAFYLGHNWIATKWPEKAQAEVFADRPFALIPVTTSPTMKAKVVPGGWELSGRSPYGSGIVQADWVGLGGVVEGTEEMRLFLLPAQDVIMDDVWWMSGMSGTGSNDIVVEQQFVPQHRSVLSEVVDVGKTDGSQMHANPLYQLPLKPFLWNETMCVFAGGLRGAATAFEEIIRKRVMRIGRAVVREHQHTHVLLGEAQIKTLMVEALTRDLIQDTMACLAADRFELEDRLRFKASVSYIAEHSRIAVQEMISHAGTSSFHMKEPLQRFYRDISMLSTHEFFSWDVGRELWGRHRLGMEPNHPLV